MPKPWIPNPKRKVRIMLEVEGEIDFPDDYPWGADVRERLEYDLSSDPVGRFADECIRAIVSSDEIEGLVTYAGTSWKSRGGGSVAQGAGLEPGE